MNAVAVRLAGRPRSTRADAAIVQAALALLAEVGFEGTTIEAVAARAGVGKATVYRRYPNRVSLVVAAATHVCSSLVDSVDTGSVEGDLRVLAHGIVRTLWPRQTRAVLAQIAAAADRHPDLRCAQRQFVAARRSVAIGAIERGIARGELRTDTDPGILADLVAPPLFHRAVALGDRLDDAYADALVAAAVAAFRRA